jgi:hypothetical protein
MAQTRDWKGTKGMSARLLRERTGQDLDTWNQRIASEGFTDEQTLRVWLTEQGVTGYAQSLLVMERFGYPDFFLTSADELMKGSTPTGPSFDQSSTPLSTPLPDWVRWWSRRARPLSHSSRRAEPSPASSRRPGSPSIWACGSTGSSQADGCNLPRSTRPCRQISLTSLTEVDTEVPGWLQQAYEKNC